MEGDGAPAEPSVDAPISDVRLTNCVFENVAKADVIENVQDVRLNNAVINGKKRDETIAR